MANTVNSWRKILNSFILQAQKSDLKTSPYPKEWNNLRMKVSFGMGAPARVPWIAFVAPEMAVSKGFYPVYLYYKELGTLILAYGVSETAEYGKSWPAEIMNSAQTISAYFDADVPRYGNSFVFRSYKVKPSEKESEVYYFKDDESSASEKDLGTELTTILEYYKKIIGSPGLVATEVSQGLFYMEKQLEDFLIQNWGNTELGKRFDLIVEDGELKSQQYKTDIGPIDILAKEKQSDGYVVIELKKNQTSDDTVGQLARYMGWVQQHLRARKVIGVIIAGYPDKRLEYAVKMLPNSEMFIYEVDFKLNRYPGKSSQSP